MPPPRCVFVTGAGGFVGHHLMRMLADTWPDATRAAPSIDITDAAAVDSAIRDLTPDVCVHLAAISTNALAGQDEDHAWRVNLHGTLHIARAIMRHAPRCQLLFVSTADAYGASFRATGMLDESAPLAPLNAYAATKAAADLALGAMAEQGLRVVRLRPFNHTGPGQGDGLVVAAFARQVAEIAAGTHEPVVRVGNLEPRRDFLDVRDVCAAYIACIDRRDAIAPGTILNLASGEPRRIGDILDALRDLAGVTIEVRVDPARIRATDVPLAGAAARRARETLDWTPRIPWSQTLRDVLDDWRRRVAPDPAQGS